MAQIVIPGVIVEKELGRGSHSVVYQAKRAGRSYAVKTPLRRFAYDESMARAFAREATILACINHPNIVPVRAAGRTADFPYLIMDLVEGAPLESRIRTGVLSVTEIIRISLDVASALSEAHRRGLVHQDVTPANILIRSDGSATLLDFGLMTRTGRRCGDTAVGTAVYSAPEQTGMLHRQVDARADLYSLGAVMYHCLAGSPPFQSSDTGKLMHLHAIAPPRPLNKVRADISNELAAVVERLLAKDPDDRYSSAWEVVAALAPLAQGWSARSRSLAETSGAWTAGHLLGRQRECALLRGVWVKCLMGGCGVVTVAGQAGAGKTSLIEEVLSSPDLVAGHPVLRGRCATQTSTPFVLLHELIASYFHNVQSASESRRQELSERIVVAAGADAVRLARLHPLLARTLGVDVAVGEPDTDELRFRSAVVGFLCRLARLSNGMIIWVDDSHWLGPADRRLLEDLTAFASASHLLIINSTRDASLRLVAGLAASWNITLGPLAEDEVRQLIGYYLGEVADKSFTREIFVRSSGNPLAVVEYVRAVIDAGLVCPDWGNFTIDHSGLVSLPLPAALLELIRHRADALAPDAKSILSVAAVLGRRFDLGLLSAVSASTAAEVARVMAEAEAHQLAMSSGGETWSFVHDCVHEAMLSTMSTGMCQSAHRRVVDVLLEVARKNGLDTARTGGEDRLYELARHAISGDVEPQRRFGLTAAAAATALTAPAPYEAVFFYRAASTAATEAGIDPDADFEEGFALACTRTIQPAEARTHFIRALRRQSDRRRRACIFLELAWIETSEFRAAAARDYVYRGLAEIGRGLPANPAAMTAVSLFRWAVGTACRWRWTGFGRATCDMRIVHGIRLRLYEVGAVSERYCGRPGAALAFLMSAVVPGQRLGSGEEYIRGLASATLLAAEFGRKRTVQRDVARLRRLVDESADPVLQTKIFLYTSAALLYIGSNIEGERDYVNTFLRGARWMETSHFACSNMILVRSLVMRGFFQEAWSFCEGPMEKMGSDQMKRDLTVVRARLARILGYATVVNPRLAAPDNEPEAERFRRYMIYGDIADFEVEDGEFGLAFDTAVAAGEAVGLHPFQVPKFYRNFWIAKARGRLEQARAAPPGRERSRRHRAARHALRQARWAAIYPPYAADLQVLRAVDRQIAGDHRGALDLLDAAERRARDLDLPRVRFDALVERARCLHTQGETDRAETEASLALQLARQYGWVGRERAVLRDFPRFRRPGSFPEPASVPPTTGASQDRRRLDAVLRVSAAASQQTAPQAVATVALDEIIEILGADRALLLLPDATDGELAPSTHPERISSGGLRPYAIRSRKHNGDQDEAEPSDGELTGFATTVVERVHAEQRSLVVTGTDEGAALGSRSAVQHGLRSILAAPVPFGEQRSGVIYVDSRIARGLFTEDDAQILITLTRSVGQALHSAEKAQLQALVAAERHQRRLTETLRAVTVQATATLDIADIPGRVLTAARPILPFDAAWVVTRACSAIQINSAYGDGSDQVTDTALTLRDGCPLREALDSSEVLAIGDSTTRLPGQRHPAASWLVAPLPLHHHGQIMLVLASRTPGCYNDARVQIARTVIDQTMVAYRNAQLVEELRHHAATDPLTGLANRRQFLDQAEHTLTCNRATSQQMNAAMIDIDHFKQVNDTYGHSVGDEVLTTIAQRIRACLRIEDILGRVGGDEFAALFPGTLPTAEKLANRLRHAVTSRPIETTAGPLTVHLSIGLTRLSPRDDGLTDLLNRADHALYTAKNTGRNRLAILSE